MVNAIQANMSTMVSEMVQKGGFYSSPSFVGTQSLFSDGLFLSSPISAINGYDLKQYFQKTLFGLLTVNAWHLTPNMYPVVMYVFHLLPLPSSSRTPLAC